MGKAILKTTGILLAILAGILVLAGVILGLAQRRGAPIGGYTAAVAVSGSMSGTFEVDDLVLARSENAYTVGDVILFREPAGNLVTHRIVGEQAGAFITQGDANNTADAWPVPPEAVVGRAFAVVPRVGVLVRFLRSPLGLSLVGAAIVGLLVSLVWPGKKREVTPRAAPEE